MRLASPEDTLVAKLEWSQTSGGPNPSVATARGVIATLGDELDRAHIERWVRDLDLTDESTRAREAEP